MKQIVTISLILLVVSCSAVAQEPAAGTETKSTEVKAAEIMALTGTIIDNKCATANKDKLAEFIKTHPKECAVMPDCAASGYSIFSGGKLFKFDKDSNAKIAEFLKIDTNKLEVKITAKKTGEELSLVTIENIPEPKKP